VRFPHQQDTLYTFRLYKSSPIGVTFVTGQSLDTVDPSMYSGVMPSNEFFPHIDPAAKPPVKDEKDKTDNPRKDKR
jgi:hypothetical protein